MRLSVYFAVLISGVLSFTAATAQSPVSRRPDLPDLNLPDRKSQGQRAIDLLGNRLPEIAAHYRKSAEEFRTLLLNDRRMKLDRKGRVFFEDEIETPLPIDPPDAGTSQTLNGTLAPLDQTFCTANPARSARSTSISMAPR